MNAQPTAPCDAARPRRDAGYVLQVQSFSVNDGEGIRTVIFLPGCPLRCRWCANPETWTAQPKLAVYHGKCQGCGACRAVCPQGLFPPEIQDRSACAACGVCAGACPTEALKILNKAMSVAEITARVGREAIFFRASGGGVTFSGGEPAFQSAFLRALTEALYSQGVDLAIETCGFFQWAEVEDIFRKMDHVFFDLKHLDPAEHKRLTSVSNRRILENCRAVHALGLPMTVRIPFIPEVNATRENLEATARFITETIPGARVELLPYHGLGLEKYRALGLLEHRHAEYSVPEEAEVEAAEALFRERGIVVVRYR